MRLGIKPTLSGLGCTPGEAVSRTHGRTEDSLQNGRAREDSVGQVCGHHDEEAVRRRGSRGLFHTRKSYQGAEFAVAAACGYRGEMTAAAARVFGDVVLAIERLFVVATAS